MIELAQIDIEGKISMVANEALLVALQKYVDDPSSVDDNCLAQMLQNFRERRFPTQDALEYLFKYQKAFEDYCLMKGRNELIAEYRGISVDFADYVRTAVK